MLSIVPSFNLDWNKPFFQKKGSEDSYVTRVYQDVKNDVHSIHNFMETKPLEAGNVCAFYLASGCLAGPAFVISHIAIMKFFHICTKFTKKVYVELLDSGKYKTISQQFPSHNMKRNGMIGVVSYYFPTYCIYPSLKYTLEAIEKKADVSFFPEPNIQSQSFSFVLDMIAPYITVIAPFIEEVLFRGHIQEYLTPKKGRWDELLDTIGWSEKEKATFTNRVKKEIGPILKTSLVFGMAHMNPFAKWCSLPQMIYTTILGIILSLLKLYTGDLWAPLVLHSLNNIRACLLMKD